MEVNRTEGFPRHSPRGTFRRPGGAGGFSLVEMMVVLAVLAVLAAAAVPFAEKTVRRDKELDLRRDLREMREAIDRFHGDWAAGLLSNGPWDASEQGYPRSLDVLVRGAKARDPMKAGKKYLRRVPSNPFGDPELPPEKQWAYHGYADPPGTTRWGGGDVYDVYCPSDARALDGSVYREW